MRPSIGIIGAAGRLGQWIGILARETGISVNLLGYRHGWEIHAAPRVLIDVSHPSALPEVMAYCRRERMPLVEGVSGLGPADLAGLRTLGEQVPVVLAANFSFGHFLQRFLVGQLAALVKGGTCRGELTIQERHPSHKKDRPSATARDLASLWSSLTDAPVADIASVRGGLPVSDHEVTYTLAGELVTVRHSVTDRAAAARGALQAAAWVQAKTSGLWKMTDVYEAELGGKA